MANIHSPNPGVPSSVALLAASALWLGGMSGEAARSFQTRMADTVFVTDFGAARDGVTNDTTACQSASAEIMRRGGGTLVIPPGTYVVGLQTFANGTGHGFAYSAADIIYIHGCTKAVEIVGYGAVLKAATGLTFGAFDPATGLAYASVPPFTSADYRADVYAGMIRGEGNISFTVRGVELDGNMPNISLGGQWGNTGYQCSGAGLRALDNGSLLIEDVNSHHHSLDGFQVGASALADHDGTTPATILMRNCFGQYNARQGLSLQGGLKPVIVGCDFSHQGRSTFTSNPSAGVDVEPNAGVVVRDALFQGCTLDNNVGAGFISASGDVSGIVLDICFLRGTTSYPLSVSKPNCEVRNSRVFGAIATGYESTIEQERLRFRRCLLSDELLYGDPVTGLVYGKGVSNNLMIDTGTKAKIVFDDCQIVAKYQKLGNLKRAVLRRCKLTSKAGLSLIANADYQVLFDDTLTVLEDVTLDADYTSDLPSTGYRAQITGATLRGVVQTLSSLFAWGAAGVAQTRLLWNTKAYTSGALVAGTTTLLFTVTCYGAALSDQVIKCALNVALPIGTRVFGSVTSANTVSVYAETTTGTAVPTSTFTVQVAQAVA